MAVGDIVRYADPVDHTESLIRFRIVELRGPRVLVEWINGAELGLWSNTALIPTECLPVGAVVKADDDDSWHGGFAHDA